MVNILSKSLCEYCFAETDTDPCPECGYSRSTYEQDRSVLPIGSVLEGRYMIGRVLGKGGFGITYLAYDMKLDCKVAIKEYYPLGAAVRDVEGITVSAHSEETKESFINGAEKFYSEARLVASLSGNPNIVNVSDVFRENETVYFTMGYLEGLTLKSYIAKYGKISEEQAVYIAGEISNALTSAHDINVLHRDISPDNIMVCRDGTVKLLDFGAARQVFTEQSSSLSVILKQGYAPPEQYQKKGRQGPWTDIYSLGATIYYAMTLELLNDPMSRMEDDEEFNSNSYNISPALWEIIKKATMLRSSERYQDIYEVLAVLDECGITPKTLKRTDKKFGKSRFGSVSRKKIEYSESSASAAPAMEATVALKENTDMNATVALEPDMDATMPLGGNAVSDMNATVPLKENVSSDMNETVALKENTDMNATVALEPDMDVTMALGNDADMNKTAAFNNTDMNVTVSLDNVHSTYESAEKSSKIRNILIAAAGIVILIAIIAGAAVVGGSGTNDDELTAEEVTTAATTTEASETKVTEPKVTEPKVTETKTAEQAESSQFIYKMQDGSIVICGYEGPYKDIVIPSESEIDGKRVVGVVAYDTGPFHAPDPFKADGIESVTISNGVSYIGPYTFQNFTKLKSVYIPDSVTEIGYGAFLGCENLTNVYITAKGLTKIDDSAFRACHSITSITIPDTVTEIGESSFSFCENLTSVTIPDSVKSIGVMAFFHCTALETVSLPAGCKVDDSAFEGCDNVKIEKRESGSSSAAAQQPAQTQPAQTQPAQTQPAQTQPAQTQPAQTQPTQAHLFEYEEWVEGGITIFGYLGSDSNVNIPSKIDGKPVIAIGDYAFLTSDITSITIPDSVTAIGMQAFAYCEALKSVTLSKNLSSIDSLTFQNCTELKSITIPDSVAMIEMGAFWDCENLETVSVPRNCNVDDFAFEGCYNVQITYRK